MNTARWRDWSCTVAVTVADERALQVAVTTVRSVMAEVELAASRFRADSDLSRINARPGRYVLVRPLTVRLVELALDVAQRTGGAVTPTVGAALLAQGYDDDIATVRTRAGVVCARPLPAPRAATAIWIDATLGRVGVSRGTVLDLGSLAKAYAVDEAIDRLAGRDLGPVLVSIGGDLAGYGGREWQIAVAELEDGPGQVVAIDDGALATSSVMGRRWAGDRHHIIDPRTGLSATGKWRSATVWAPTAVEANILSTWALVDAEAFATALAVQPRPARLVDHTGEVVARHGWPVEEREPAPC